MKAWSAPGKLMLAGEYAVLRPGRSCLVAAVERRLFVSSSPAEGWSVRSGALTWTEGAPAAAGLSFAVEATLQAKQLGATPKALTTRDELSVDGLKLGLGSSAAATVATLRAAWDGPAVPPAELWHRADGLHRAVQNGRGSGADVASSVHGGVLRYGKTPLTARRVELHRDVRLVAIWTGAAVQTAPRLATFEAFVDSKPSLAERFESLSEASVDALEAALASGDAPALRTAVSSAREALLFLQEHSGLELETAPMRRAIEVAAGLGIGAKQSGAGGGDCAVAITACEDDARRLVMALGEARLDAFLLPVAKEGLREEDF